MSKPHHPPVCFPITLTRINHLGRYEVDDLLLREEAYNLICNGKTVACLHCMPDKLEELAVGRLFTLGLLQDAHQIRSLNILPPTASRPQAATDAKGTAVKLRVPDAPDQRPAGSMTVTLDAPPPAVPEPEDDIRLTANRVHELQAEFEELCNLYRLTGAAHSCALADPSGVLLFYEDIARHNALDKLIGAMLLRGIGPQGKLMIFSGRLALDMLEKASACGVRLLVAPGAPSLAAVELARTVNTTILGFVRQGNINIYTCPHRII